MTNLTHLFECHFADESVLIQSPDDISTIDPTRSAFYDVQQRLDEVIVFGVCSADHTFVVDLRDGHFEIDGVPFDVHGDDDLPEGDHKYRLVYFRRNWQTVNVGTGEQFHEMHYFVGWQTTINGKNYQRTISVF